MKKTIKKTNKQLTVEEFAEECMKVYNALLAKGFSSEQSFRMLIELINKS